MFRQRIPVTAPEQFRISQTSFCNQIISETNQQTEQVELFD